MTVTPKHLVGWHLVAYPLSYICYVSLFVFTVLKCCRSSAASQLFQNYLAFVCLFINSGRKKKLASTTFEKEAKKATLDSSAFSGLLQTATEC